MNPTYDFPEGPKNSAATAVTCFTDESDPLDRRAKGKARAFALCLHYRERISLRPVPDVDRDAAQKISIPRCRSSGPGHSPVKGWTRDLACASQRGPQTFGASSRSWKKKVSGTRPPSPLGDSRLQHRPHMIHTKGNGMWVAGGVTGPQAPQHVGKLPACAGMIPGPASEGPAPRYRRPCRNLDTFATMLGMPGATDAEGHQACKDLTPPSCVASHHPRTGNLRPIRPATTPALPISAWCAPDPAGSS